MAGWRNSVLGPPPCPPGSIKALTRAYARGVLEPSWVVDRLAARLETQDFGLAGASPFSDLCLERASRAAQLSTQRWRDRRPRGPLDGVPLPLKDHHHIAGLPTRAGVSRRQQAQPADGELVLLLEALGALVPGKTHCTEWGLCPVGRSAHTPLPRNPFHAEHGAGGSSTGAAAAVALGLVPAAMGSDAGGSIRIPAALQGLFGAKPGMESLRPQGDLFGRGSLTVNGPIASCTADLALLLGAMGQPVAAAALGCGVAGCRLGLPEGLWAMADPAVASRCRALLTQLEVDGAVLAPVRAPLMASSRELGVAVVLAEGALALDSAERLGQLGPEAAESLRDLRLGSWPPPGDIPRLRAALISELAGLFEAVDLLALPTTLGPAPLYGAMASGGGLLNERDNHAMCATTFAANLCGLPAASMPAGMVDGLPVGLQLVGPAAGMAAILAVTAQAERLGVTAVRPPGFEAPERWS